MPKIIFISLMIMYLYVSIAFSFQPELSPAGRNYLVLDGKDDYAVLDYETFGALFKQGTRVLTVEAWVYPTLIPNKDAVGVILSQQIPIYVAGKGHSLHEDAKKWIELDNDDLVLMMFAYTGAQSSTGTMYLALSRNKWHHIAFQVQDKQITWIYDNTWDSLPWGIGGIAADLSKVVDIPSKDFVLGGYGREISSPNIIWGAFAGLIDEVRISDIPRHDTGEQLIPQGRFESDENTLALWHFDEPYGSENFEDSSGNGYRLIGMNGASTGRAFAVDSNSRLTTTWSSIKSK